MSDETIEQNSTDFERALFAGEGIVTLEIQVTQTTHEKMLAALARKGLEPEAGLRIMLTMGLGYLEGQRFLQSGHADQDRLLDDLLNLESKAAVMKYHAYDYMRDNKIMEMRMRATQSMAKDYEQAIGRLRTEIEVLQAENEASRQELERARSSGDLGDQVGPKGAQPSRALSSRIGRLLRRQPG